MQQSFMRKPSQGRTVLLVALILIGVSAGGLIGLQAQQVQTTVTVSSATAVPGETKTISVTVANAPGVASIQGSLSFDPSVVQLGNVVFASNFTVFAFNVQSNTMRFVATLTRDHPTIQNGELFHMDGRAVGQPGQSSPLNLTLQIMGDVNLPPQEIPRSIVNGTFTIVQPITPPPVQTPSAKPPVADFTYSPQNPTTADTVQFIDLSSSPNRRIVAWQWDFGDSQSANTQTPSHRYNNAGTFSVKLTVTDNGGANASVSKPITITAGIVQLPTADFTYSPQNPTIDDTIQFTDISTSPAGKIVSWLWDFGDGATATVQNPTHQYVNPGTFSVKLTVTDNRGTGASSSVSKAITVAPSSAVKVPVVSVFPNPASDHATFRYKLPKGTTKATLLIFNLPGAEVFEHDLSLTANEFRWDLKDDQGRDLPNGPYLYFVLAITPSGPVRSEVDVLVIQR